LSPAVATRVEAKYMVRPSLDRTGALSAAVELSSEMRRGAPKHRERASVEAAPLGSPYGKGGDTRRLSGQIRRAKVSEVADGGHRPVEFLVLQ
jgi:hypothetical protein